METKEGRISRAISQYLENRENRPRQAVRKKTYLLLALFTGALGGHRFYAKRYYVGLLYLLLCWAGFSIAMTIIDLMAVIPIEADEEGIIWI